MLFLLHNIWPAFAFIYQKALMVSAFFEIRHEIFWDAKLTGIISQLNNKQSHTFLRAVYFTITQSATPALLCFRNTNICFLNWCFFFFWSYVPFIRFYCLNWFLIWFCFMYSFFKTQRACTGNQIEKKRFILKRLTGRKRVTLFGA